MAQVNDATQAQLMLDSIGDAIVSVDQNGRVTYLNPTAEAMTGWPREQAAGRLVGEVLQIVHRETRAAIQDPMSIAVALDKTVSLTANCLLIGRDGREVAIEDSAAPIHDAWGRTTGAIMVFRDVGAALGTCQEMAYHAQHDELTGLPNRLLLNDRLTEAVAFARRHRTLVAVLFVDVDGFKVVNDSLGHPAADGILRTIASRMRGPLRCSDTVSRYGGDEFVIVLPRIEHARDAVVVAGALLTAVAPPHVVGGRPVAVTISVGVCTYPEHGEDAETLLAHADAAMYEAKRRGPGSYWLSTDGKDEGRALSPAIGYVRREASTRATCSP
jgi:diguanylate cyclase (GGDEF)-like protein/PAS domain S-box-containing protein